MKRTSAVFAIAIVTFCTMLVVWNPASQAAPDPAAPTPPKYQVDPFWPKPLPGNWVTGEVGGTCIDAHDNVFIVTRGNLTVHEQRIATVAPPVIEFDPEGNVINSWGDRKVMPNGLHGCFVDYLGNIWIAGNHDAIVQKYTPGGKLLLQIGVKGKFDTSDGTETGAAMNSSHTLLNRPSSVFVDPSNGDVYISDGYGNRRVVVFDKNGHYLRQWGRQGTVEDAAAGVGGVFVGVVHCVVIGHDGMVYVCDRAGDRIEVFDKMGNFKRNIWIKKGAAQRTIIGSAWWLAFSRDPSQNLMYVVDGGDEVLYILDHATGQILSSFGRLGHQTGEFDFMHTVSIDSKGNLIIGETIDGRRVQKFSPVVQ
ncbi:MAG: hypothetical protein ACRD22_10375 [Terriglobia bacterium]